MVEGSFVCALFIYTRTFDVHVEYFQTFLLARFEGLLKQIAYKRQNVVAKFQHQTHKYETLEAVSHPSGSPWGPN